MTIEKTVDEIIIRLPSSVDTEDLQDLLNYLRYKEITTSVMRDQQAVDELAGLVNKQWWTENKERLTK